MSTITLRLVKGAPLTNQEVDDNFANLNNDKYEAGDSASLQDLTLTGMSGPIAWNVDDGALDIPLNADVTLQTGQEFVFYAKATEAISNGDVVMFAGAQGGHLLIAKADMSAVGFDPTWIVGVATQDFAINEFGYTTALGKVRGLDTSALSEGDILYVDPTTAGAYTTTKPSSPNHIIQIAAVTRSHATQGSIQVRVTHIADTDEVPEGATNLYFTNARAVAAIKADADWNATNWDTAYSWGNHASAGYLTSFTETDPTVPSHVKSITTTDISQWDTAYGWGNHASAGYLTSLPSHNHDTLYYTKTQADSRYVNTSGDTINGLLLFAQNPVGTTYGDGVSTTPPSRIQQLTGDNDGWRLYGESPASNDVKMVFEIIDDIETGDTWVFRNKKTYGDYSATEPFKISGEGNITALGTITASGYNNSNWDTAYSWGNHASQGYATQTYVNNAVSNLVDSAPTTLDTLNELAAALGDDPNFATTVSNSIGTKWTQDNTKISNWDTAYSWGNHASQNYAVTTGDTFTGNITINAQIRGVDNRPLVQVFNTDEGYFGSNGRNNLTLASINNPRYRNGSGNYSTIFHDAYHPNADKWTTARNNNINLTGDVTGYGSASVDGTGNWTVTVNTTVRQPAVGNWFNNGHPLVGGDGVMEIGRYIDFHNSDTTTSDYTARITNTGSALYASGQLYADGNQRVFADNYHPNADKWTTARTHTVTLTGDVTGSASQSVDGSGNRTWTITTTVGDDSHSHNNYMPVIRSSYSSDTLGTYILAKQDSGFSGTKPSGSHNGVGLITTQTHSGNYFTQLALDTQQNALWIRSANNTSAYGSFQRLFADNYHPNADKWTTARTLSLTGDVTGSVSWDGSANASITTTVANDSHTHDGRYYTESEADSRFANVTGDTFTGNLQINGGYLQAYGLFYLRDDLNFINSGADGWHTIIEKNGGNPYFNAIDSYRVSGTTVIDSSRNLVNVGSISASSTISGTQLYASDKAYIGSDDDFIRVGSGGGGKSGVFGNRMSNNGSNLSYGAYLAYDAHWNGSAWQANRTTLTRKWMTHIGGYHDDNFHINRYGGDASVTWSDSAWTRLLTLDSSGSLTVSGYVTSRGALKVTETGTAQHILIGNQDSGGANKPAMIRGVNGYLEFGYGNSWSGEGGTMTSVAVINGGFNLKVGNYQVNGITVIDSSRNLTSINSASVSSDVNAGYFDCTAGNAYGVRFWNGSDSYSIKMAQSSNRGRVSGETTSDYNMYLRMQGGGTNRGFVFETNSGLVAGIDGGGTIRTIGQLRVGEGQNSSYIWMNDADHGGRFIHCNSNRIGFLNSSNGWGSWSNDDGSWQTATGFGINNTTVIDSSRNISNVNQIRDNSGSYFRSAMHSGSDFANGTLVTTSIPASSTNGASFVIEVTGKSYSSEPPFSFIAQGYLYNNTIINYSGVNNGDLRLTYIKAMNNNGYLSFWWPRVSYWNSFEVHVRDAGGNGKNTVTSITNSADPSGATKKVTINFSRSVCYDKNVNIGNLHANGYKVGSTTVIDSSRNLVSIARVNASDGVIGGGNGIGDGKFAVRGGDLLLDRGRELRWNTGSGSGEYIYSKSASPYDVTIHSGSYDSLRCPNNGIVYIAYQGSTKITTTSGGVSITGALTASGNVTAYSDIRKKKDVIELESGLDYINKIDAVRFTWKENEKRDIGFIAQDVEKHLPEFITDEEIYDYTEEAEVIDTVKTLDYSRMTAVLWKAVKEQQEQIETLKSEIEELKNVNSN